MSSDVDRWMMEDGQGVLVRIGVKHGHRLLDFGCGEGIYSVPAARVCGEAGRVIALDKSAAKLEKLRQRARSLQLSNIEVVSTSGVLRIPFPEAYFDVVLLYDVLHHYYFDGDERATLLKEAYRVLKGSGLLSVYPEHMDTHRVKGDIRGAGFTFQGELSLMLIHEERYTRALVLSCRKPAG
jgi:ubiquinone/menaquinone biosynthesis C-methylase UbiE